MTLQEREDVGVHVDRVTVLEEGGEGGRHDVVLEAVLDLGGFVRTLQV